MDIDLQESPEAILTHPGYAWKGFQLPPAFSLGTALMRARAVRQDDIFHMKAFIAFYILTRSREDVEKELRDVDKFRVKVLDWVDSLNLDEPDLIEVEEIFVKIIEGTNAGRVTPISTGGPEKGKA